MPKIAKYLLIAVAALAALLAIAAGIIAATFNPNDYKPLIIKLVQEEKQRTLTIPGEIKLSFFPKIGADLGKVSISEHKSSAEFASVDSARVSLALMPLLAKQLVVDQIRIDGLRANIVRYKDGSSNFDDLLSKEEGGGGQIAFDIDSVRIGNTHLVYDDRQQGRKFEIANLELETGKIADDVPGKLQLSADIKGNKPQINAKLALKSGFRLDIGGKRYVLDGLDAEVKGALAGFSELVLKAAGDADLQPDSMRFALDGIRLSAAGKRAAQVFDVKLELPKLAIADSGVSGGKLSGEAKLVEDGRIISATFGAPSFEGTPQAFKLPSLALEAAVKDATLDVKAKLAGALAGDIDKLLFSSPQLTLSLSGKQGGSAIDGSLSTPLSVNLQTQAIDLPKLAANFTLPNPAGGTLALKAGGNAAIHLGRQSASVALNGNLDQSTFTAKLGLAGFAPSRYSFDIGIDQLDVDRYRSKAAAPAKSAGAAPPAEQAIDLSALEDLNANGSVRVGALKVAGIKASNVRFDMRAAGGKLDISPLAASLYGGSAAGAVSASAGKPARFALRQTLSGINVGPLLKDAIGKDPIEGRGNVQLDVTAAGATVSQVMKGLNGNARLELRDGAVRGVNIAQTVRGAKAKIGAIRGDEEAQSGTASGAEKTDFSEMSGSFRISNGVARNDDLDIKSPLMRVTGSGNIDLGEQRVDYLARAAVVSTLQGQGGPELQALKGLTVPVKLSGPFSAIGWRVDFAGLAKEMAKQKIDERKDEVKDKVREKLNERLKGLFGK